MLKLVQNIEKIMKINKVFTFSRFYVIFNNFYDDALTNFYGVLCTFSDNINNFNDI